jgi:hypothetical protein
MPKNEKIFPTVVIVSPRPICPECNGSCHCRSCNGSGVTIHVINSQYVLELVPSMLSVNIAMAGRKARTQGQAYAANVREQARMESSPERR